MKKAIYSVAVFTFLLLLCSCLKVVDLELDDVTFSNNNANTDSEEEDSVFYVNELTLTDADDLTGLAERYPALESLTVSMTAISDIYSITACTGLKQLEMRGCAISCSQFDALKKALPTCDIHWDVPIGGELFDSSIDRIVLPEGSERELIRLTYFPNLQYADLRAINNPDWIMPIRLLLPDVEFEYTVSVCGVDVSSADISLDLTGVESVTPEMLSNVKYLDSLSEIDLRGREFSLDDMNAFADSFPDKEFLFSFTLAGLETDSTAESLDISRRYIGNLDEFRAHLRFMKRLTYLDMCYCGLNNDTMAKLREDFPDIKFVWMLYMGQYSLRTDAVSFSTLVGFDEYTHLSSGSIEVLKYCTDLEALDLGHHYIRDLSVLEYLPKLRILILADNRISDLTPIASLKELRYLEIFMNYGVHDISPLAELPNLIDLNMSYLSSVKDYSPLYGLEHLQRLWINQCETPPERLEELKSNLPEGCEICCSETKGSTDGGWRDNDRHWMQRYIFRHNCMDEWFYENP